MANKLDGNGLFEPALLFVTQAIDMAPDWATAYNFRGVLLDCLECYAQSLADFSYGIQLRPCAVGYYNRAMAHEALGDDQARFDDLCCAARLNPSYSPAYRERAQCYEQKGEYELALQDQHTALQFEHEPVAIANILCDRSYTRLMAGDWVGALRDCEDALATCPDLVLGHNYYALIRFSLGHYACALRAYDTCLRLDPRDGMMFAERALCRHIAGDNKGALEDLSRAFTSSDRDVGQLLRTRAVILFSVGEYDRAFECATESIRLHPSVAARAFLVRARIHRLRGEEEKAEADLAQVRERRKTWNVFDRIICADA